MKTLKAIAFSALLTLASVAQAKQIVIAHRGASGYLPEHTMAAKAMAYAMKPDFIEQDVVMTKDDELVVLHDHYLDRVTDVAQKFPNRARPDGRYYAIDFTLEEIKSLNATEGFNLDKNGKQTQIFPERFPMWKSEFKVHTFAEEIELIQGLNKTLGYDIGIYPEIKAPWFHRSEGKDISLAVLKTLKEYGYTSKDSNVYLQCFDPIELKRIHDELLPHMHMDLKLVQLMAYNDWNETMIQENGQFVPYDYNWMFQPDGMEKVAKYADGIGPWKPMLVDDASTKENIIILPLVEATKKAGLKIHPYTFRSDEGRIPSYANSFDDMLDIFYNKVKVDGVFTDYPDKVVNFLHSNDISK
ncbi:glycerophosphodiester phosphodiesterase [Vibrio marisflavi]|uniref:glycerophosphodiester phosphodiesterase n=1 Tax=Vibrio marisflavi CECT 7928 TaxID=634439 RepID=A0ABM8ZZE7_9VIBR|nr:glycerophosphodiester phosphodiesterase [Vibrio marisflavi]CAH0536401.1 Glycerophosphodiester phosphodiesterase, periplasmic [Vibrio marisflavi CECT 7928]